MHVQLGGGGRMHVQRSTCMLLRSAGAAEVELGMVSVRVGYWAMHRLIGDQLGWARHRVSKGWAKHGLSMGVCGKPSTLNPACHMLLPLNSQPCLPHATAPQVRHLAPQHLLGCLLLASLAILGG